jgi:hypothetical protein
MFSWPLSYNKSTAFTIKKCKQKAEKPREIEEYIRQVTEASFIGSTHR